MLLKAGRAALTRDNRSKLRGAGLEMPPPVAVPHSFCYDKAVMTDDLKQDLSSLRIDHSKKTSAGRSRFWGSVAALTTLAAAVAVVLIFFPTWSEKLNFGAKPAEVEVTVAARMAPSDGNIALTAGGYVVPRHRIEVSSKISGRVEEILIERGDTVRIGQVLARLDDRELRAQLAQARASKQAAEARLNEALAGSRPQEIERAQATLQQGEATRRTTELSLERARELNKKGVLSQQALDDAQNAFDVAAAQVEISRRNLELARIGPRREQIELAKAQLSEAQAAVRWLEEMLDNSIIRAPASGTILERLIEKGEMVTTGFVSGRGAKAALVSIADLNDLEVELDISEAEISRVRLEQPCIVSPDAYPERRYDGRVREIAPEANRQKATIQVKVAINRPDSYLRPETNAKVHFLDEPGTPDENGIFIPKTAVAPGPAVFLVRDGRARRQNVTIGKEIRGQVEVTSGLAGGEQIISKDLDGLADGIRVQPKR